MRKNFDDLTIQDDFMFCQVMKNKNLCKTFLEMLLADKIGNITHIASQSTVAPESEAKFVRLDILVQDEKNNFYDIEMQVVNEHNVAKRMRYYQSALDVSFLDKGEYYTNLKDSYIIFVCLFDFIGKNKAVYFFENICLEDGPIRLRDGTKKIIINVDAFKNIKDKALSGFLEYIKTGCITTKFSKRIEKMIRTIKQNEQARQEYRFISAVVMDAKEEGRSQGFTDGVNQTKRKTASALKAMGLAKSKIAKATGLSLAEIEKL